MSYSVGQRRQEMAVRVALGVQRSRVIGLVVRQDMSVAALGLAAGLLGAFGLTRFVSSFLYDVKPTDIQTGSYAGRGSQLESIYEIGSNLTIKA
ncbi:FtsX-like permease family protein [Alloacidobacterium dinghuense]|uniref:FtsX-like permease family protein n=1 Tax=Alloacidobacterium dinghuense TaxID=2763107 RepID=UPI003D802DE3